eukprot:3111727-Prymnesium_polylepis.2
MWVGRQIKGFEGAHEQLRADEEEAEQEGTGSAIDDLLAAGPGPDDPTAEIDMPSLVAKLPCDKYSEYDSEVRE